MIFDRKYQFVIPLLHLKISRHEINVRFRIEMNGIELNLFLWKTKVSFNQDRITVVEIYRKKLFINQIFGQAIDIIVKPLIEKNL